MSTKKVAMALSGGVDSALSAYLLKKQGLDVVGIHFKLWNDDPQLAQKNFQDAKKIANKLNIPFELLDLEKIHRQKVVDCFLDEYRQGRALNPCIICNRDIKFGIFYDWAIDQGYDYIATGHYAKILTNQIDKKSLILVTPTDQIKDQTYFLYQLNEDQLKHIIFPLADLTKNNVVKMATDKNIHVSSKKNSAGICFIKNSTVREFIQQNLKEKKGQVIDENGNVIGSHKGIHFYTVGQRQGFYINAKLLAKSKIKADKHNPPALFIISKNIKKNQLIVGTKAKTSQQQFTINNLHHIYKDKSKLLKAKNLFVKIRHSGKKIACNIEKQDNNRFIVKLKQAEQGISPGQAAVFYESFDHPKYQYICLGGGTITEN